jgi:hypothetical protein
MSISGNENQEGSVSNRSLANVSCFSYVETRATVTNRN